MAFRCSRVSQLNSRARTTPRQQHAVRPAGGSEAVGHKIRFKLHSFDTIVIGATPPYLVRGMIPQKDWWSSGDLPSASRRTSSLISSCTLPWAGSIAARKVRRGPIVYCSFEGSEGINGRIVAYRKYHDLEGSIPFWLMSGSLSLVRDHAALIADIRAQMGSELPVCVVLDTLNRSLAGSESSDQDMSHYIRAADAIVETFGAAVIIVHHCGLNDSRPRGHTSLTGAVDAQIACRKSVERAGEIEVEFMKDGPAGSVLPFKLDEVEIGMDEEDEVMTSLVAVESERNVIVSAGSQRQGKLSAAQRVAYDALADAVCVVRQNGASRGWRARRRREWRNARSMARPLLSARALAAAINLTLAARHSSGRSPS